MAGSEHYLVGGRREALTHYIFRGFLLGIEDVMAMLGSGMPGDSAGYYADAKDADLIKALRMGKVKSGASNWIEKRLLPPVFWKTPSCAFNAFTKGVVDVPADIEIPGLRDVQGWRVLGWSQQDLADKALLSETAILKLETERADTRTSTVTKVRKALEGAGIEFINRSDGAVGVVVKPKRK